MSVEPRRLILLLAALWSAGGCAINRDIRIQSDPPGADVFASSQLLGTTPLITDVDALFPNRAFDGHVVARRTLVFIKPGFENATVSVGEFSIPPVIEASLKPQQHAAEASSNPSSNADRLRELQKLYDSGLIDESEYQQKRKSILGDI